MENDKELEKSIRTKQHELINICYDRLFDLLGETTNETTIIKCIETIRKDMTAALPQHGNKENALNDTYQRVAEIEKQLKKL